MRSSKIIDLGRISQQEHRFLSKDTARLPVADGSTPKGVPTVSKHRKTRSRGSGMSARQYVTTGVTGAAMVGIGVLLAAPPGAPAPTTAAIQLASTESVLPLSPLDCLLGLEGCAGLRTGRAAPPRRRPLALGAALGLPPIIGPGGFLFGDGLDALEIDPDCDRQLQWWQRRAAVGQRRRRRLRRYGR